MNQKNENDGSTWSILLKMPSGFKWFNNFWVAQTDVLMFVKSRVVKLDGAFEQPAKEETELC